MALLSYALEYERREEIKRRYLGDVACGIWRALTTGGEIRPYSAFAQGLGWQRTDRDTRDGEAILDDLLAQMTGKEG